VLVEGVERGEERGEGRAGQARRGDVMTGAVDPLGEGMVGCRGRKGIKGCTLGSMCMR
jgi:hypothetical protein